MKKTQIFSKLLSVFLVLLAASCQKEAPNEIAEESLLSTSENVAVQSRMPKDDLFKSVRQATSRFHSTTQAINQGYNPDDHCVSVVGLGGMGYHWANPTLVDAVLDPLKPEVILYATGNGGNLRLVALEYIVLNVGQPRPMFGDRLMDIGGAPIPVPHWTLHVWLYEHNPSGVFAPFNPNITCP